MNENEESFACKCKYGMMSSKLTSTIEFNIWGN